MSIRPICQSGTRLIFGFIFSTPRCPRAYRGHFFACLLRLLLFDTPERSGSCGQLAQHTYQSWVKISGILVKVSDAGSIGVPGGQVMSFLKLTQRAEPVDKDLIASFRSFVWANGTACCGSRIHRHPPAPAPNSVNFQGGVGGKTHQGLAVNCLMGLEEGKVPWGLSQLLVPPKYW